MLRAATPEPRLAAAEQEGVKFVADAKVNSIEELRAMSAEQLQSLKTQVRFRPIIDGYFLPSDPYTIYSTNQENIVPVILGSNADEGLLMGPAPESLAAYVEQTKKTYGDKADEFLKLYPASNDAEAREQAYNIGRDQIAWQMRIWADMVSRGGAKTWRYYFSRVPPVPEGMFREQKVHPLGAFHQAEIPYVFGHIRHAQLPLDRSRPQDFRHDDGLLDRFCENWQSQWHESTPVDAKRSGTRYGDGIWRHHRNTRGNFKTGARLLGFLLFEGNARGLICGAQRAG